MNSIEFNEKYKVYLKPGFRGLEINIEPVTKFLDTVFEDLVQIPGFTYSQIKLKFNMARFYSSVGEGLQALIESYIDHLVAKYDAKRLAEKLKENE